MDISAKDKQMLDRITEYANQVMPDIDPQNTKVSLQLQLLKPIMEELASEQGIPVEEIFIRYMDLATRNSVNQAETFREDFSELSDMFSPGKRS